MTLVALPFALFLDCCSWINLKVSQLKKPRETSSMASTSKTPMRLIRPTFDEDRRPSFTSRIVNFWNSLDSGPKGVLELDVNDKNFVVKVLKSGQCVTTDVLSVIIDKIQGSDSFDSEDRDKFRSFHALQAKPRGRQEREAFRKSALAAWRARHGTTEPSPDFLAWIDNEDAATTCGE